MTEIDFLNSLKDQINIGKHTNDLKTLINQRVKLLEKQCDMHIVGVELPNMYEGSLNSKRIKEIDTIADGYLVSKSTVRSIFCEGAEWYKKQIKDNGN